MTFGDAQWIAMEAAWRRLIETHLGRMITDREWKLARKEIAVRLQNDVEMGVFDVRR